MRKLRTSFAVVVAATLLAGSAVTVVAQSEEATESIASRPGGITRFEGTLTVRAMTDDGVSEDRDWGTSVTGEEWVVEFDVDDARLDGTSRGVHNVHYVGDGENDVRTYQGRLSNAGGSWLSTGRGYQDPETTGVHYHDLSVGEGGYEGLVVIMSMSQESFSPEFDVEGIVFVGGLPDQPQLAPSE